MPDSIHPQYFQRAGLHAGETILLHRCGTQGEARQFQIAEHLGSGATMISYRVTFESADLHTYQYVLKEVYPLPKDHDVPLMRRDTHLQLDEYESETRYKGYYARCKERYRRAYALQLELSSDKNSVLNLTTSTPLGLYEDRASSTSGNYALYGLFQFRRGTRYDAMEESDLEQLLTIQAQIATVVKSYHEKGFLWLDIKEKNVFIVGEEAVQSVTLFDFDSLISIEALQQYAVTPDAQPDLVLAISPSSEELLLPEELENLYTRLHTRQGLPPDAGLIARKFRLLGRYGEASDLFLLGSLFFKRLFGRVPTPEDCAELQQNQARLPESRYLAGCKKQVRTALTAILKKLLQYEQVECRYQKVKQYQKDLGELLRLVRGEDSQEQSCAIWQHFSLHPLLEQVPPEEETIHLLLVGLDHMGEAFLDMALQTLQLPGKQLQVTVLTESAEQETAYLKSRPALAEFFQINGTEMKAESYGSVTFLRKTVTATETEHYEAKMQAYLQELALPFRHALVDVGIADDNLAIARAIRKAAPDCVVHYAWQGNPPESAAGLLPVSDNSRDSEQNDVAELERMALNTHLIWEKNLNLEYDTVQKEFRKPYAYRSCMSFVTALYCRLYSLGIDLHAMTPAAAAAQYTACLKEQHGLREALIACEHRRWVTEKLCTGFVGVLDLEQCSGGKTKETAADKRWHVCLCRSRKDWALSGWSQTQWDAPTEAELAELDELDSVSVRLHGMYRRQAALAKKGNLLDGSTVSLIRSRAATDGAAISAFQEWHTCMKDLWDEDASQCYRYQGLKQTFLQLVEDSSLLSPEMKKSIAALTKALEEEFYPIYASERYYDYKNEDVKLVDRVPFLLTYSHQLSLAVPYTADAESTTKRFGNLASATVINPAKLLYFCYCKAPAELENIQQSLASILAYLTRKKLRASVEFLMGVEPSAMPASSSQLQEAWNQDSKRPIRLYLMPCAEQEFPALLADALRERNHAREQLLLEKQYTYLSGRLYETGIYDRIPSFQYDSASMTFQELRYCDFLRYIAAKVSISVTDLTAFSLSSSKTSNKPEFYGSYKALWRKYCKDSYAWKNFCSVLKQHAAKQDLLAEFPMKQDAFPEPQTYSYLMPSACKAQFSRLLHALEQEGLILAESHITHLTAGTCRACVVTRKSYQKELDAVFSRLQLFAQPDYLEMLCNPKTHAVQVRFHNLEATDVDCAGMTENAYALFEYFQEKGYLIGFRKGTAPRSVSFTYATPQIQALLTMEGKLLEIYTYHKARETGGFDDIRSGFEVEWKGQVGKNEFDCVLTKGFSTLFVECKATREIKTEFYARLSGLTRKLGINAKAVLIADTEDTADTEAINARQRAIGEEVYDVITISDRAAIHNIGNTLLSLL